MQTPVKGAPMLDWALWYAAQGLHVFPLRKHGGTPAESGWQNAATCDADAVRALWQRFPQGNIGVSCEGHAVFDVDVKNGRDGRDAYDALGLGETLTVRTPSGGTHYFFKADGVPATRDRIGEGIDVQGSGVYVVGAGSYRNDEKYKGLSYSVVVAAPVAVLPEPLRVRLGTLTTREDTVSSVVSADSAPAITMSLQFLREVPPAVAGLGGDRHTYDVARQLKRFGVSASVALGLMLDAFNPRCSPPWTVPELRLKVSSAFASDEPLGVDNPLTDFGTVTGGAATGEAIFATPRLQVSDIKPRPWIVRDALLAGSVTALIGPGGVGKSLWQLYLAICTATGDGAPLGLDVPAPRNVLVINNEDDLPEMYRRYYSACHALRVDPAALVGKVYLFSGVASRFRAVARDDKGRLQPTPVMAELVESGRARGIAAYLTDPFVKMHDASENDAAEIDRVADVFVQLATRSNAAVLISHHTRKPPQAASDGYAGDANASRGSSALPNATRLTLTMFTPSEKDCKARGVPEENRRNMVRVDDGKANYGPYRPAKWFEKAAHDVPGLPEPEVYMRLVPDKSGTPQRTAALELPDDEAADLANEIASWILGADATAAHSIYTVAKALQGTRDEWASLARSTWQDRVRRAVDLSPAITFEGDDRRIRLRVQH